MNKNNILMFAYGCFIFACLLFELFFDFPMWGKIVSAITIASVLFTVSDTLYNLSTMFAGTARGIHTKTPLFYSRFDIIKQQLMSCDHTFSVSVKTKISSVENADNELRKTPSALFSFSKFFVKCATVFVFLGFLSFFCVATFDPVYVLIADMQDEFCVFAFGLIILNQFISNIINKKLDDKRRSIIRRYEWLDDKVKEIENSVSSYLINNKLIND